jgi:hypothetical protein
MLTLGRVVARAGVPDVPVGASRVVAATSAATYEGNFM